MKKLLFAALTCLILVSCDDKMDMEKASELVAAHPYLAEYHIGVTNKKIDDCDSDYVGSKINAYITLRGANTTAYYYKMNNLRISEVQNLIVEDRTASCEVILIPDSITKASESINDVRPGKAGEKFTVVFEKYDNAGWRISDFYPNNKLFFKNIWQNDELVYRVVPEYYSMR